MEDILKLLGIFSASSILVFAVIKYASQQIFESYLKKSIETHKSELERINFSHQIQFASLHKERATVIKELYYRLYDYQTTVLHFFLVELSDEDPEGDFRNRLKEWKVAVLNFSPYFHKHRIYFDKDLCLTLDNLNNELERVNEETQNFLHSFDKIDDQIASIQSNSETFVHLRERSQKLFEETIMPVSDRLEEDFRKILGV
ncbi:hypothetical protein [Ekhidna sp.]|uniref:hypothetical protein n=1 Tax=Ekhidna sp. TaxID=2608089 RepID=UPI003B511144